jgi:hypothetical protein
MAATSADEGIVRRRTRMGGVLSAALWLALTAVPVAAGGAELPPQGASGNFGVHTLVDTADYPGARCVYVENPSFLQILTKIKVRPPIVFAFNRTGGRDQQTVGWLYRVWTANDPSSDVWQPLASGHVQKATATDSTNARFTNQTYDIPASVQNMSPHPYFLVQVVIRWYYPTRTHTDGRSLILVQNYYAQTPYDDFVAHQYCHGAQT